MSEDENKVIIEEMDSEDIIEKLGLSSGELRIIGDVKDALAMSFSNEFWKEVTSFMGFGDRSKDIDMVLDIVHSSIGFTKFESSIVLRGALIKNVPIVYYRTDERMLYHREYYFTVVKKQLLNNITSPQMYIRVLIVNPTVNFPTVVFQVCSENTGEVVKTIIPGIAPSDDIDRKKIQYKQILNGLVNTKDSIGCKKEGKRPFFSLPARVLHDIIKETKKFRSEGIDRVQLTVDNKHLSYLVTDNVAITTGKYGNGEGVEFYGKDFQVDVPCVDKFIDFSDEIQMEGHLPFTVEFKHDFFQTAVAFRNDDTTVRCVLGNPILIMESEPYQDLYLMSLLAGFFPEGQVESE